MHGYAQVLGKFILRRFPIRIESKNLCTKIWLNRGVAIAQWIGLCLPSCCPGFNSQACHLGTLFSFIVKFVLYLSMQCEKRTKINKKEAGFGPFF